MPVRQKDARRALELLQQYRLRLDQRQQSPADEDQQLNSSLDRVISVFQSQLFNALLDIQEYYELTITTDSQNSVHQPEHVPSPGPSSGPSPGPSSGPSPGPSSDPASAPLSPPASGEPSKPGISPKPRSFKSPAPPIPTGVQPAKPTPSLLQPQPSKKYRAPPPPAKPTSNDQTNNKETPKEVSQNGVKEFDLSDPTCEYSTISPLPPVTPGERATVSALASSTVQTLLPSSLDGKGAPKTTSPGLDGKEAQKGSLAAQSPSGSSQARFTFSGVSPTISPGPFSKGPLLSPKSPGSAKLPPTSSAQTPVSPRPVQAPVSPRPVQAPVSPRPVQAPVSPRPVQAPKTPVKVSFCYGFTFTPGFSTSLNKFHASEWF